MFSLINGEPLLAPHPPPACAPCILIPRLYALKLGQMVEPPGIASVSTSLRKYRLSEYTLSLTLRKSLENGNAGTCLTYARLWVLLFTTAMDSGSLGVPVS